MRAHTMGRRLGRVVAVAALGLAVSLTGGTAAYAGSAVFPGLDNELAPGQSVVKSSITDSGEDPVSLRDFEWL
ncbi:hypothetical protein O7632_05890 [Solwaraspora sp. WMMD406]|uniref:hypothetical protein n=1 Tax=Solwaraspora sp. WMMD406 TaxID=3016095 RepID=UPI0024171F2D|nr:hypothetical protein [Solwaraspora sp. WMMD406]MDG4763643.1 hypothetical protein [Solwaraspora sp. WMMD406]